jgi:arabinosaccharide transport system substrate-binding protein
MHFSLGKPILVLALIAILTGPFVWHRPEQQRKDLLVWSTALSHVNIYQHEHKAADGTVTPSLIDQFHKLTGLTVDVELLSGRAQDIRLVSLFMSQTRGPMVPDLVEIEISSIGQYLRAPINDVGVMPLNGYLAKSPEAKNILTSRMAAYSKIDPETGERIYFGIPNDVHPCTITYRKDLFDKAGVDLEQAKTWPQFQEMCLKYLAWRKAQGLPWRPAVELYKTNSEQFIYLLLQEHLNIVDSANQVHLTDPRVAEMLAFYAEMVAGPRAIGDDVPQPGDVGAKALASGDVGAMITPDWRASQLQHYAPQMAGEVRMMPMPIFHPGDAPTTTWGGTMIGIPRSCPHPDEAWKLAEFLYLSPAGNAARIADKSLILPPVSSLWSDPAYHQADPFYASDEPGVKGQKVEELYIQLAAQMPERDVTPFTALGKTELELILEKAEDDLDSNGPAHLEEHCAGWLAEAQKELQERIDFERFSK